jgi:hypothetical protein
VLLFGGDSRIITLTKDDIHPLAEELKSNLQNGDYKNTMILKLRNRYYSDLNFIFHALHV